MMRSLRPLMVLRRLLAVFVLVTASARAQSIYVKDVDHAVDAIQDKCGFLLESKGIKWKKIGRSFIKQARKVKTDQDHLVLLTRLLARLRDGHAQVRPREKGKDVRWPDDGQGRRVGPGMFWCRSGKKIYVRNAWGAAAGAGIKPGMEVLAVDGKKVSKWLDARIAAVSDHRSFSTEHHALFHALQRGLADPAGTRMKLELRTRGGKKTKRTVTYGRDHAVPFGPAFPPKLEGSGKSVFYGRTEGGFGYLHVRRCRREIVAELDTALAKLGDVEGMILDFRGNSGGGFDHEAFLGRFIPEGKKIHFAREVAGAGPVRFGGPVVVIVNATCVSAGETGSGQFKEEGRGYLIGESPTAGMSSQKTTIELPSGLFALYVSTHSNKGWYNGGQGIEGVGVIPHEIVDLDPDDLAAERDTLILHAEKLLRKFPQKKVPYVPKRFGWRR